MNKEEIIEYNQLCAEVLGYNNKGMKDLEYWVKGDVEIGSTQDLEFHSDWNRIMEVCISIGMKFVTTNKEQLIQQIYDKLRNMETNS